jgi:transketolase
LLKDIKAIIFILMPAKITNPSLKKLELTANKLRKEVIKMLTEAKSGHTAGSLGTADIFTALYFHTLKNNPERPQAPYRDRLVLSNGHICPILYATLAEKGYFSKTKLKTLRKLNSDLEGHPVYSLLPGIENTSGSLGQGLSQSIGMAMALKMDSRNSRVYCITGDGELNEGQIWEAAMFAPKYNLSNLTWIIDRNNIQIDGTTNRIMPLEVLKYKLESFGWYVIEINGHDFKEIIGALDSAKNVDRRPTAIIAHTIPGKGVSFMEYKFDWHGKVPSGTEAKKALEELNMLDGEIKKKYEK